MPSGYESKFMNELYYKYYVKWCVYIKLLSVVSKVDEIKSKQY